MFTLEDFTPATLLSVNPRSENHGTDKMAAADLKFEVKVPNAILSEFGSQLRDSFYWNNGEPAQQGELVDPLSDKPNLRNPMIRVQCHPTEKEIGRLCMYVQQELSIRLLEPVNVDPGDIERTP